MVKHASKISLLFAAENSSKFLGLVLDILLHLDNLALPHSAGIPPLRFFKSVISPSFAFVPQLIHHSQHVKWHSRSSSVPGIVYLKRYPKELLGKIIIMLHPNKFRKLKNKNEIQITQNLKGFYSSREGKTWII